MTTLWRITTPRHIGSALSGDGAALYPGRWNPRGVAMVYATTSASLAILEYIANARPVYEPERLALLRFTCDAKVEVLPDEHLPADWRSTPAQKSTREFGARWVRSADAFAVGVPSAVLPTRDDYTVLINPLHDHMSKIEIVETVIFRPDERLLA